MSELGHGGVCAGGNSRDATHNYVVVIAESPVGGCWGKGTSWKAVLCVVE